MTHNMVNGDNMTTTAEKFMDSFELMMDAIEADSRQWAEDHLHTMMYLKNILEGDVMDFMSKHAYKASHIIDGVNMRPIMTKMLEKIIASTEHDIIAICKSIAEDGYEKKDADFDVFCGELNDLTSALANYNIVLQNMDKDED